jgi:hypothetical protein
MVNNILHSDITLLLLLYYLAVSVATELLEVDYCVVLRRWWSKRLCINLRTRKKQKPQRRSQSLPTIPIAGHRPEILHPRFRRTRSGDGRGKSQCNCKSYYYYFYYMFKLLWYKNKSVRSNIGRKVHACTSTSTCSPTEKF